MTPPHRRMRGARDWSSAHDRARTRAAERLDGPLEPREAAWLDGHLAECAECRAIADAYAANRLELRGLRDFKPLPPRDLWARTAASIEREAGHRIQREAAGRAAMPPRRFSVGSLAPYALLTGALVVAVVVGSTISSRPPNGTATAAPPSVAVAPGSSQPVAPVSTPLAVDAGDVAVIAPGPDGGFEMTNIDVTQVCPATGDDCSAENTSENRDIAIGSKPRAVIISPDDDQAIVVPNDGSGSLYVVDVGGATPTPTTAPTVDPASPSPTASDTTPSASLGSAAPPSDSPPPSDPPSVTVTATPDGRVAIISGVELVDQAAAYSPDGRWFAFAAVPTDGSAGPDVFAWQVGSAEAQPLTTDHASVFGSWFGDQIVGSTVGGENGEPTAFVLDPETGQVSTIAGLRAWRPVVDPTGTRAVFWDGTMRAGSNGAWLPDEGRLVLADVDLEAAGGPAASSADGETILEGPIADWDARWDETGTRLAVWVANPDDPTVGRLSLFVVDPESGRIDLEATPLADEPALAGFSIGGDRLAWVRPDEAGDEARVRILAWNGGEFGQVESSPGGVVVVR